MKHSGQQGDSLTQKLKYRQRSHNMIIKYANQHSAKRQSEEYQQDIRQGLFKNLNAIAQIEVLTIQVQQLKRIIEMMP
ncbi:hypothetical protein FGO68_gene17076 [Halteria grandinella]|uniref:Uncharacterized protein n=1 Tax=Halteria grandinella TaxID=5974 RepID=A0A8J8P355_HALGN|nr:hypothetical protein FGO68_gene17076 [Halteria grandinella]